MSIGWIGPLVLSLATGPIRGGGGGDWRPPELRVLEEQQGFAELREIAMTYLGRPYRMGGVGDPSLDCSGFTCRVFAEAGYAIPRVSRDQARVGDPIELDEVAPGDLLFFADRPGRINHVGIYLGDGQMIHASSVEGEVIVTHLSRRWYQERLVGARRVLGLSGTPTQTSTAPMRRPDLAPVFELEEHGGAGSLPLTRRLPARLPAPSAGPEVGFDDGTSLALRTAFVSEEGLMGLVVAPEATLSWKPWAVSLALAVPIRFDRGRDPTVGTLESAKDWLRFLRHAQVGLRGADLELRLDRLGDVSLAEGLVVEHLAPGSASSGVPGFAVKRSPLAFFGAYRGDRVSMELLTADIADPAIVGAGLGLEGTLDLGLAYATDQRSGDAALPRAINAVEMSAVYEAIDTSRWSVTAGGLVGALRAVGETGYGGIVEVVAEHRFGRSGASAVTTKLRGGVLGAGFVDALFGPTYLVARREHLSAIEEAVLRPSAGGEILVRLGQIAFGAAYADAWGEGHQVLDRRLLALAAIEAIPIGRTRFLDLRVAYGARGLFDTGFVDVLHAGARLRLSSWLAAEAYAEKGERLEAGAGVTVSWAP